MEQLSQPPLLVQLDKLTPAFTEEEAKNLKQILANPLVKRFFLAQFNTAVADFLVNEADTDEQKQKLTSRFLKMKGVQYVCTFILNNFQEEKAK